MNKIVFIGAIDKSNVPKNGETVKNQLLLKRLAEVASLVSIDTLNWKRNPLILIKIFYCLVFYRKSKYIISSASRSAYKIISLIHFLKMKREVYYWVIGGSFADNIINGYFDASRYRFLSQIIVEGDNMRQKLEAFTNVTYCPNFKYIDYRPQLKRNIVNPIQFIFISRLSVYKGVNEIIDATVKLNNTGYASQFIVDFYGKPDEDFDLSDFKSRISAIPNVNYKSFLDLRKPYNYDVLATYDAMLFPTYWKGEGFPGVIIDAYICGLPVIATDWSLNKDIIEKDVTGIIIPPRSVDELAEAMKWIMENRSLAEQMKEEGYKLSYKYDVQKVLSSEFLQKIGLI